MNCVAIIPARGGSKRIPRKNIKSFFGKPMLSYAIETAKESKIFDEIMVSTEDIEIASIARAYGAVVPFMRSKKTADDFATTYDVLEEVLKGYDSQDRKFDIVCGIYPCVPLLKTSTLILAYQKMLKADSNAIMPVCKYSSPIEWAMKIKQGILIPDDAKAQLVRSQDIEPKYFDAGMFYFCKTDVLLQERTLMPKNTLGYIISEKECQDIDTLEDWSVAELKYKILNIN